MIKMDFMLECENCPHLEVTSNSIELTSWANFPIYEHTVTCENIQRCKLMREYLRKEMKKDGN